MIWGMQISISGWDSLAMETWRSSSSTPMITARRVLVKLKRPSPRILPRSSLVPRYCFANARFTTTTVCELAVSASLKNLPLSMRKPKTRCISGPTARNWETKSRLRTSAALFPAVAKLNCILNVVASGTAVMSEALCTPEMRLARSASG